MVVKHNFFKHLIFSIISLIFVSCSIEWFSDAEKTFNSGLECKYYFYEDSKIDASKIEKNFTLGSVIGQDKFPKATDFDQKDSRLGYKLDGYKWLSKEDASKIDSTILSPESPEVMPSCIKLNEDSDLVSSFEVTGETLYFCGIWSLRKDIPYIVQHKLQKVDGSDEYEFYKTDNLEGTAFAETLVEPLEIPGFDPQPVTQQTINPNGTTVVTVLYNRKEITLNFYESEDADLTCNSVKGLYGQKLNVPDPDISGYIFLNWYYYDTEGNRITVEEIDSFPAENRTYYGSWLKDTKLKINFYDYGGKNFSGAAGSIAENYNYGDPLVFDEPEFDETLVTVDGVAENEVVFEGWYSDADCIKPVSDAKLEDILDVPSSSITIYAKWKYKYVYIDTAFAGLERGFASNKPVSSLEEAKKYFDGNFCKKLYCVNTLNVGNSVNNPSGLTEDYGVVIHRYKKNDKNSVLMFSECDTELVVNGVTVDGGGKEEIECDAPLVTVVAGNPVLFKDGFIVQNNNSKLNYDVGIYDSNVNVTGSLYLGRVFFFNKEVAVLNLTGDVSVPEGLSYSKVAEIKMTEYPGNGEKVKVLSGTEEVLKRNYFKFASGSDKCNITQDGYIVYSAENTGGTVINPLLNKIVFETSDLSSLHPGDVIKISAKLNGTVQVILTGWDYSLYHFSVEEIDISSAVENKGSYIELKLDSLVSGSYTLYVSGVYNGVAQDAAISFTVN